MFQAIIEWLFEVVFEAAVRLPGYGVLRCFHPAEGLDFDGNSVFFTGLAVWLLAGGGVIFVVWRV